MSEKEWVDEIRKLLMSSGCLSSSIYIENLKKLPYALEIIEYDLKFTPKNNKEFSMSFETDMLIYEHINDTIKPRIVIEAKLSEITTHDAITYSYKAQHHKSVTPYLRYGIMLGDRKHHPLPGRLFRHGGNFDFMISFKELSPSEDEKNVFVELLHNEINYSKQLEEMFTNSRNKNRKHYFIMQNKLTLTSFDFTT